MTTDYRNWKSRSMLVVLGLLAMDFLSVSEYARQGKPDNQRSTTSDTYVPAYHPEAPRTFIPDTLSPEEFANSPSTAKAYEVASKIKAVLYQLPCYCYCDKADGHKSLHDCYATRHASGCDICKKEAIYAYERAKQGKSVSEIRSEIIVGKWRQIELPK